MDFYIYLKDRDKCICLDGITMVQTFDKESHKMVFDSENINDFNLFDAHKEIHFLGNHNFIVPVKQIVAIDHDHSI